MSVDNPIRRYIDSHLIVGLADDLFFNELEVILGDIVELLPTAPANARDSASYLAYVISRQYMRSGNHDQQSRFAQRMGELLRRLYHEPAFIAPLGRASAQDGFALLLVVYRVHYVLTMNGLLAEGAPLLLDAGEPLRVLQIIVGSVYGPWHAHIRLQGGLRDYYHCRIRDHAGSPQIEIGRLRGAAAGLELRLATWNMQGTSATAESKWRTRLLQLARVNDLVAVQEAGTPPASAQLVTRLDVLDQFGTVQVVEQYLWQAGTLARPEAYQVYFLDVQRLRVNLALVLRADVRVDVREVLLIADGVVESGSLPVARPALGVRLRRRAAGATAFSEEVTVYNFHALSGGGSNAPRMLREVSWHTDTPYVLLGDFNRDPTQGNWVSPQDLARIEPASDNTHPSTGAVTMLVYAVVNGSTEPIEPGVVDVPGPSDHLPVSYVIRFS